MTNGTSTLIITIIILLSLSPISHAGETSKERIDPLKQLFGNVSKSFNQDSRARLINGDRLKAAQLEYISSEQKAGEARKKLTIAKQAVRDLKERADRSCRAWSGARCAATMAEINEKARESLLAAALAAIENLNKAAKKADQAEDITDQESEAVKSQLKLSAESINAIRLEVEQKERKEPSNYASLARRLNTEIASSNRQIHLANERIALGQLTLAISRTKALEPKLRSILLSASKEGKNVKAIAAMTDKTGRLIDEALTKIQESKSDLNTGNLESGRAKSKEARSNLSKAHALIKEIYMELKSAGLDKNF